MSKCIVYPICKGNQNDCNFELLMSLRSIEKNISDDVPVYILSEFRPPYLSDKINFIEVEGYMDALYKACDLADEVLWMNDDIFILKPTNIAAFSAWCVGKRNVSDNDIQELLLSKNRWRHRKGLVLKRLRRFNKPTDDYSTHTPYLYQTQHLRRVLSMFDFGYKTPIETAYANYVGVPSRHICRLEKHHDGVLPLDTSCYDTFNYDDKGATVHNRGYLLGKFPKPSKYENHGDQDTTKLLFTTIR